MLFGGYVQRGVTGGDGLRQTPGAVLTTETELRACPIGRGVIDERRNDHLENVLKDAGLSLGRTLIAKRCDKIAQRFGQPAFAYTRRCKRIEPCKKRLQPCLAAKPG